MCMHLTNYAINKDNPNFKFNDNQEKMDIGHKRSLTSVLDVMLKKMEEDDDCEQESKHSLTVCLIEAFSFAGSWHG